MKKFLQSLAVLLAIASLWLLAGCSIQVSDKDKDKQKVDIQTPIANLKVDTSTQASDNGIPVYPGAKPREADKNGDKHRANVNIGGLGFGLKVIAAEYDTSDPPDKVKSFYEDKLKQFGDVLVCKGTQQRRRRCHDARRQRRQAHVQGFPRQRLGAQDWDAAQPAPRIYRT